MRRGDEYPANLVEFIDWFPSDESYLEYLEAVRWPVGFECPMCGNEAFWSIQRSALKQCRKCLHQTSATAGTIFEGTRKSLETLVSHDVAGHRREEWNQRHGTAT